MITLVTILDLGFGEKDQAKAPVTLGLITAYVSIQAWNTLCET